MIIDTPSIHEGNGRELRRLHDVAQQHIRALKAMGQEPSPAFITSLIELKLDSSTMFEWQRHSQSEIDVPHYKDLLDFLDHRAQASEISAPNKKQSRADSHFTKKPFHHSKSVTSFAANSVPSTSGCTICKTEKHPLYSCQKFRSLPHDKKMSIVKATNLCMNCLGKDHHIAQCKSIYRCRKCQKPHHTVLHLDQSDQRKDQTQTSLAQPMNELEVSANIATAKLKKYSLLMTCEALVMAPDGSSSSVRALIDSGSSASFVSERLVQSLCLRRVKQKVSVTGIGGTSPNVNIKSIANFKICSTSGVKKHIEISALIVPRVVSDLPTTYVPINQKWYHLSNLQLADPNFNVPGRIDLLLGVDVFTKILLNGRREGIPGSPVAVETLFGWVLCGNVESSISCASSVTVCHTLVEMSDDTLHRFWEIEEPPTKAYPEISQKERMAAKHFNDNYTRMKNGQFVVPLPKESNSMALGESRSQAVRRFLSLERSLHSKNRFSELDDVVQEYFDLQHAELVPPEDLQKPTHQVFYLPIHAVYKSSSTTTKVRAVFDASAKSETGVSFNDTLLKGPTVHSPLIDVILRFRLHRVAITADVSKMYRAIHLAPEDKDLHRFVWRSKRTDPLRDFRMTRVTFGVTASSFAANMAIKQNAMDFEHKFPLAAKAVENNVYVDDCLTGADNVKEAILLHCQLQQLFECGGFLLRKWNSSEPEVLKCIDPSLRDSIEVLNISGTEEYSKTLGLEWNTTHDHFRLTISKLPTPEILTKRVLVSNVARIFDVLGWISPTVIKMKILLQHLWEAKLDWDNPVPTTVKNIWSRWNSELQLLSDCHVPRYPFPKNVIIVNTQLHGFSDASEDAYGAVVYIRGEDSNGHIHVGLVLAKTKVAPLKRLTIPRLELCGAYLLNQLLDYVKCIYQIPITNIYAWTDSTIVLNWLTGSSRRFKTFVGNRISTMIDTIPTNCWNHVDTADNPADCASRGLFPSELANHDLWWRGPKWLYKACSLWPVQGNLPPNDPSDEKREICLVSSSNPVEPVIPVKRYSTFTKFQRIVAWMFRFAHNCQLKRPNAILSSFLTVKELHQSEMYWIRISQATDFPHEIAAIQSSSDARLPKDSVLKSLHPFIDPSGVLRVGGRLSNAEISYAAKHPVILRGKNPITQLILQSEHQRMLHAGPTLLCAAVSLRFHIINLRKTVRSISRRCVICRKHQGKLSSQLQGQLPPERINPGPVFEKVGLDYAGPFNIKYGFVRKPTIIKAYICLFVSLSVKAVHLEVVSDLTTDAFIATLRRFISRRGLPILMWSDHGTNFVGANREIKDLYSFLQDKENESIVADFCSSRGIEWSFIPERAPHFGGLWESSVKSMKTHLRKVTSEVKLTFEELQTVICQVEACMNSRPLAPLNCTNDEVTEILTPAHFIIGQPLIALPDRFSVTQPLTLLRRWQLCQNIVNHFWRKWSSEYLTSLNKYTKNHPRSTNIAVGDIVVLRDEMLFPTRWPLARVIRVHPGKDNIIRVVTIKTAKGIYKRPINKLVVILPMES